jgi:DNA-binding CsgD family transcriptional regulator
MPMTPPHDGTRHRMPSPSDPQSKPQPQLEPERDRRMLNLPDSPVHRGGSGLLLLNTALQPIAYDLGAGAILQPLVQNSNHRSSPSPVLPPELLEEIRSRRNENSSSTGVIHIPVRGVRYVCRYFTMQSRSPGLSPWFMALFFERERRLGTDPIMQLVEEYHLTDREEEVLRGIALGLATKDVAKRMRISPNTVKSFVRLIMVKLGVTSRASIMVKLLQSSEEKVRQA